MDPRTILSSGCARPEAEGRADDARARFGSGGHRQHDHTNAWLRNSLPTASTPAEDRLRWVQMPLGSTRPAT